jgi:hypothetical protein
LFPTCVVAAFGDAGAAITPLAQIHSEVSGEVARMLGPSRKIETALRHIFVTGTAAVCPRVSCAKRCRCLYSSLHLRAIWRFSAARMHRAGHPCRIVSFKGHGAIIRERIHGIRNRMV